MTQESHFALERSRNSNATIYVSIAALVGIIGIIGTIIWGAFQIGSSYAAVQGEFKLVQLEFEGHNEHIRSLERNYDSLVQQMGTMNTALQAEVSRQQQITFIQQQIAGLVTNISDNSRAINDLTKRLSETHELTTVQATRVDLLKGVVDSMQSKDGGSWQPKRGGTP